MEKPSGQRCLGGGKRGPRAWPPAPLQAWLPTLPARIFRSTEARLTSLRPRATSPGLAFQWLPCICRAKPPPAPHPDLPSPPRSDLHLPCAFMVWSAGQCETGLALGFSEDDEGATPPALPCPQIPTVGFSWTVSILAPGTKSAHFLVCRRHVLVYTASQP